MPPNKLHDEPEFKDYEIRVLKIDEEELKLAEIAYQLEQLQTSLSKEKEAKGKSPGISEVSTSPKAANSFYFETKENEGTLKSDVNSPKPKENKVWEFIKLFAITAVKVVLGAVVFLVKAVCCLLGLSAIYNCYKAATKPSPKVPSPVTDTGLEMQETFQTKDASAAAKNHLASSPTILRLLADRDERSAKVKARIMERDQQREFKESSPEVKVENNDLSVPVLSLAERALARKERLARKMERLERRDADASRSMNM